MLDRAGRAAVRGRRRYAWRFLAAIATPAADGATERHVGYDDPPIASRERCRSRAPTLPGAGRERRIGFTRRVEIE